MAAVSELVAGARDGDEAAWRAIVEQFSGLVWATARAHRLAPAEAADVVQTTWLRLVEHLDRVHDPERLGAWLATTARRESLRHLRLRGRELPAGEVPGFELAADNDPVDQRLLGQERQDALRRAFAAIGERCQALLRLLAAPDPPSYEEISAALDMPIGAIGPTRARCLEKLRRRPELASLGGAA
jgi:RNA polymerase sigma factor (sigma-70 family)